MIACLFARCVPTCTVVHLTTVHLWYTVVHLTRGDLVRDIQTTRGAYKQSAG